jgi:hypothetical protein
MVWARAVSIFTIRQPFSATTCACQINASSRCGKSIKRVPTSPRSRATCSSSWVSSRACPQSGGLSGCLYRRGRHPGGKEDPPLPLHQRRPRRWMGQPHVTSLTLENERYLNYVADKFDLRRDVQFNSCVTAAHYRSRCRDHVRGRPAGRRAQWPPRLFSRSRWHGIGVHRSDELCRQLIVTRPCGRTTGEIRLGLAGFATTLLASSLSLRHPRSRQAVDDG